MRILHISTPTSWRGGEQQIAWLMEELRTKNIEQFLFCPTNSVMINYAKRENFKSFEFSKTLTYSPFTAWKVKRICMKYKIDLIHVHDSRALTLATLTATFFKNKARIIISRKVDFPLRKKRFTLWKYNHHAVAKIVCVSETIKEIIAPAIQDKTKLEVVYDGIDLKRFTSSPQSILRQEYNIPSDKILIGNVAAIAPHKDYFTFVKTAKILIEKGFAAHFFIIGGDGGDKEKIEIFIKAKRLKNHISLTGFRKDITSILPELDIFLFTSKSEGFGTSVLDALASNVSVVSTNAGGISEYLKHEKNALLATSEDAEKLAENILTLSDNLMLKTQLRVAGKQTAACFSKKKMATNTLTIYSEALSKNVLNNT
ncbi:MAG: glycosyltransferase involved in cell wall biosynthesis [Saprospiraceae bacterium]|jgi:glycosyltransferase involved in cell wall biosynthesis